MYSCGKLRAPKDLMRETIVLYGNLFLKYKKYIAPVILL